MSRVIFVIFISFIMRPTAFSIDEKPAKSLTAVFHPEQFEPFMRLAKNHKALNFNHEWERNKIWVLANMAHTAYHEEDRIREIMNGFEALSCRFYEQKGAEAFLAVWKDKAVLAFRGTQSNSLNDLIADILFLPRSEGKATIHGGFLREINKLWKNISDDLQSLAANAKPAIPVWVTGHSLGGAMATIAGMRFAFEEVVTFGEPRVGWDIGSAFLAKAHLRYINGHDPVPRLPQPGVDHHGKKKRIVDADGSMDWRYDHAILYYSENLDKHGK